MKFGERIQKFRKELNLTQNELAEKLFISYQAVSQWETGVTKPDIEMLPKLAEVFNKSIDALFNDEVSTGLKVKNFAENKLYIVVAKGKDLLNVIDYDKNSGMNDNINITIDGDALDVQSNFSVTINGSVEGDVVAGNNVECSGVNGDLTAGNNITCMGVNGDITAGNNVECNGVCGNINAGYNISANGICGDVNAGNDLTCDEIKGNVNVGGNITCENIEADKIEVQGEIISTKNKSTNTTIKL